MPDARTLSRNFHQLQGDSPMTQTPTNNVNSPATDSSAEMIRLARQATARIVTAALEATAESADMERAIHARASSAPDSLPAGLQIDPQQIRDFTRSGAYLE